MSATFCETSLNKTVRKLLRAYEAKGVFFDIRKQVEPLPGNRIRLRVKFQEKTQLEAIERHKEDVRRTLKLDLLEVEVLHDDVSIAISKQLDAEDFLLTNLLRSPIYREARNRMSIAVPIGMADTGFPVVVDLCDFPHALVSGGTGSGKTCAIKSILVSLLTYRSGRVNLILGDRANDLSQFKNLPHLSYPLIEDFDTLLKVLLVLKDEMERRLSLKNTPEMCQSPFIIVLIDEFTSFMNEAPDKRKLDIAADTLTQLLRRGRHTKIHFILGAHNPIKADMKINTADLPVRMVFKVAKQYNSIAALGAGGAEKLKGKGDMLFKGADGIQHMHGAYIDSQEIEARLSEVRANDQSTTHPIMKEPWFSQAAYRGAYGFTITEADLRKKESELHVERVQPSFRPDPKSGEETLFARVLLWTLDQKEISCNQISENFGVGWRRANGFISRLYGLGIVGNLDAKLPRKVLVHSVEDASPAVAELLREGGFNAPRPEVKKENTSFRDGKSTPKIIKAICSTRYYTKGNNLQRKI